MSEELQKVSDDPEENFKMENEFLKLKIAAQFGGDFGTMSGNLPPEIENQFLKNVLQFEDHAAIKANSERTTVAEKLGNPEFADSSTLSDEQLVSALEKVITLYAKHDMQVNFIADYTDRIKYEFMTQELLQEETDTTFVMPGMTCNYIFEEFHPNHAHDIEEQAIKFINSWFYRDIKQFSDLLASEIPLSPNNLLPQKDVIKKIDNLLESFDKFENTKYSVDQISYDMEDDPGLGMAFAEGGIAYDAIMENGECIHFEGPFKIYFAFNGYYWDVMYFVFPGFKW